MLYEVVLRSTYYGQQCVNRWNYASAGTPATVLGSFGLLYAMGFIPDGTPPTFPSLKIFSGIRAISVGNVIFNNASARAIYDVADFYETPFPSGTQGGVSGEGMSPTQALGFRSTRVRTDISRATKRFVGVTEANTEPGGVINSAILSAMDQLADFMGDALTYDDEGNTITFTPCVVSKEEYTTPRGNRAYRYYPTLSAQMAHVAQGIAWEPYTQVRTQTSRQYGRGI